MAASAAVHHAVSKSGNTFYLVIDRNAKGANRRSFMNLVDEADLLALMEDEDADAVYRRKEAAAQAEQERKQPRRMRKRLRKKRRHPVLNRLVATKLRSMLPHS